MRLRTPRRVPYSAGLLVVVGHTTGDIGTENLGEEDFFVALVNPAGEGSLVRAVNDRDTVQGALALLQACGGCAGLEVREWPCCA